MTKEQNRKYYQQTKTSRINLVLRQDLKNFLDSYSSVCGMSKTEIINTLVNDLRKRSKAIIK